MKMDIFVTSLPGICDAGLPIAASKAGAIGLLDLSFQQPAQSARCLTSGSDPAGHIDRLIAHGSSGRIGFILPPRDSGLNQLIASRLEQVPYVVLTLPLSDAASGADELAIDPQYVKFWRKRASQLGLVVTSAQEAKAAAGSGFDFLLVKGSDAGGLVGLETSYVLLQAVIAATELDVHVWGGVSHYTALASTVAGAAGIVLDWQLALLKESPVKGPLRRRLEAIDGSETRTIKLSTFKQWRALALPGMTATDVLAKKVRAASTGASGADLIADIVQLQAQHNHKHQLVSLGQDAAFAKTWAARYTNVAKALASIRDYVQQQLPHTGDNALRPGSALAVTHNTRYPIVQGPMTRVSDVPAFCDKVEQGGALPFLAVAVLKGKTLTSMLRTTRDLMGSRSWGVGLLAFNEPELFREQMAAVEEVKPPFAILAGGRADQALAMEAGGTLTYLHAPSTSILADYLQSGVRNFIFEGRECGGHVGPRTSFVLWSTMIDAILAAGLPAAEFGRLKLLFAGGIHDALSAAMVSALALPLTQRGAQIGVLMGTAYIFTEEAVSSGAVVPKFQQVAQSTRYTEIADSGGGHAIRLAPTPYFDTFLQEKERLEAQGLNAQQVRKALDEANLGRLRVASKGVQRKQADSGSELVAIDESEQVREGVYMIGQVVALHDSLFSIAQLHADVCEGASRYLREQQLKFSEAATFAEVDADPVAKPLDIAIIGIATLLPGGANDRQSYWENILDSRSAITEVPGDRFVVEDWFDGDRKKHDKIYGKWGGFVDDILFDPLKYGIPPTSIPQIEPMQLIALELTEQALRDAGLLDENPYLDKTGIILGIGGGAAELGSDYIVRSTLPRLVEDPSDELMANLPEWTEDSFAGILLNVVAGRVSNRFDFGGINFSVDAACGSSLASVYLACRELSTGAADVMLAGGCDATQNPFGYMCFAKTGALSPRGIASTFDANADGIVISEGHAVVVLKRLADAERDGDRIYGVIKAASSGSDGKSMGLTAPRMEGQLRTLRRAYAQAGYSPSSVGLFEAHGTGTAVGDRTEALAVGRLLQECGAPPQSVAIGSVKSMIGHTKCAAGVAGLIKSTLALHHRVLPPTLHVKTPSAAAGLVNGPLYVNSELRPWISSNQPRRASVSAFGFGGTNFHVALEEYTGSPVANSQQRLRRRLVSELLVFNARSVDQLASKLAGFAAELKQALDQSVDVVLAELAYGLHLDNERALFAMGAGASRSETLAIVTESLPELLEQLAIAQQLLTGGGTIEGTPEAVAKLAELRSVFYTREPLANGENVCFLFPGQGSQYLNMLRDLALEFHEVADCHQRADAALSASLPAPLSRYIFPKPFFDDEERQAAFNTLKQTRITQPALGVSSVGMLHLLESFGVAANAVAGHSYGEFVALYAAGCMDERSLYGISFARGDAIMQMAARDTDVDLGSMLATSADRATLDRLLDGIDNCWVSNLNSPTQTILSGTQEGLDAIAKLLEQAELLNIRIPVGCAFHSPIMAGARERLVEALAEVNFEAARIPVMSNVTAGAYPAGDAQDIVAEYRSLLEAQLTSPVRFQEQIENLYNSGSRVFIEVGPGNVLSKLVRQILGDKPHAAISTNMESSNHVKCLQQALAQMIAQGMDVDCERLYSGRDLKTARLASLNKQAKVEPAAHMWWLNGSYARPVKQPRRTFGKKFKLQNEFEMEKIKQQLQALQNASTHAGQGQIQYAPPPQQGIAAGGATRQPPVLPRQATAVADMKAEAMLGFQQNMRKFIETQQAVMLAYFQTRGASAQASFASTPDAVQPAPAYPVQPIPRPQATYPSAPVFPVATAPAPPPLVPLAPFETAPPAPAMMPAAQPALDLQQILLDMIAEKTGYPQDILDANANLEAELGIDSIKRVEIIAAYRKIVLPGMDNPSQDYMEKMSAVQTINDILDVIRPYVSSNVGSSTGNGMGNTVAVAPTAAAAPASAAPTQPALDLQQILLDMIAEKTGYPQDILDANANLEAELGIDSIKRVEIIAAYRKIVLPGMDNPSQDYMEKMSAVQTINDILDVIRPYVGSNAGGSAGNSMGNTVAVAPTAAAAPQPALDLQQILLDMIAEKTGYPQDILDANANLEAELGIDSIKRVEIIAAYRKVVLPGMDNPSQDYMEKMSAVQTINDILDVIRPYAGIQAGDQQTDSPTLSVGATSAVPAPAMSSKQLTSRLIELISERTGYPPEILAEDANLEAELGIDSIKRVEIVAAYRAAVLPDMDKPPQAYMESMSTVQTIADIVGVIQAYLVSPAPEAAAPAKREDSPLTLAPAVKRDEACPRCVVRPVAAAPRAAAARTLDAGAYLIVHRAEDDGQLDLCNALVKKLATHRATGIPLSLERLGDQASALLAVDQIRRDTGGIVGLIDLVATNESIAFPAVDTSAFHALVDQEAGSLLYLLQALDRELQGSDAHSFTALCATVGGGEFRMSDVSRSAPAAQPGECRYPWRGAIAGLVKCAAKEWPKARFAAVDFESLPDTDQLLSELALAGAGEVEIGYRDGERLALTVVSEDVDVNAASPVELSSSDAILVTGGARGITAEIAKSFSRASAAHLILVGRSPAPVPESAATASIEDPVQLRKVLVEQVKAAGELPQPRLLEQKLKQLLANREINNTLASIRSSGGSAEYVSCDVADPTAFGAALAALRSLHQITGVIHGAGIIEDKMIVDKSPESFRRVINTKVDPLLEMLKQLDLAQLKVCLLFSSVAGYFGNRGQADYAAANEILNRMACWLQHEFSAKGWPGKVAALNWGPWCGAGMVTSEVERQFRSRGIGLITPAGGCKAAWNETVAQQDAPVRVILGPGSWTEVLPGSTRLVTDLPLLGSSPVYRLPNGSIVAQVTLDSRDQNYLADHVIDGKPVLPLAVAAELMAETAALAKPEWHVSQIEGLRLFEGVVISADYREVSVHARKLEESADHSRWSVAIFDPARKIRPLYEAVVTLAPALGIAAELDTAITRCTHPYPKSAEDSYSDWLFHGPAYRSIRQIVGCDRHGIDASISTDSSALVPSGQTGWILDPLVLDTVAQLAILWSRANYNTTLLPNALRGLTRFAGGPTTAAAALVDIVTRFEPESGPENYRARAWVVADGRVVSEINGLEGFGNAAINRIAL